MKRVIMIMAAASIFVACGHEQKNIIDGYEVKINEHDAETQAVEDGRDLANALFDVESQEEFTKAKAKMEAYGKGYKRDFGGQAYINFVETCNQTIDERLAEIAATTEECDAECQSEQM